jgi:uncharacterized membrane protein YccC
MRICAGAGKSLHRFVADRARVHHGLQLAAAIVAAYAISALLRLPESFCAVMSTLIVMRPSAGATKDASRDRIVGTLAGAACGLFGVLLCHLGANALFMTRAIVALLAFASATVPSLRSAAVAALIVMAAGNLPSHPVLQTALLRVAQIAVGVGVATAIAIVTARKRPAAGKQEWIRDAGRKIPFPAAS